MYVPAGEATVHSVAARAPRNVSLRQSLLSSSLRLLNLFAPSSLSLSLSRPNLLCSTLQNRTNSRRRAIFFVRSARSCSCNGGVTRDRWLAGADREGQESVGSPPERPRPSSVCPGSKISAFEHF